MNNPGPIGLRSDDPKSTLLRIQSILFNNDTNRVNQVVKHLECSAGLAIQNYVFSAVELSFGDCSVKPVLSSFDLEMLKSNAPSLKSISYKFFSSNLGSACGHNTLFSELREGYVLIMNPDIMLAPDTLIELAKPFRDPSVGLAEARQLPIEHPKEYDLISGETSWATTACAMIPAEIIKELNGFDEKSFFLYCDDLDLSWRIRLAQKKVIYQPSAVVYHDKRLSTSGQWMPSRAEREYSAEAALMLAHKYSRPDIVDKLISQYKNSGIDYLERAVMVYRESKASGRLPKPIDPDHAVGRFYDGLYAKHRFAL